MDLVEGQLAREVFFNLSYQHMTTEGIGKTLKHVATVYDSYTVYLLLFISYSEEDFSPQNFSLIFLPGTTRTCVGIDIIDDIRLEDDEQFSIEIMTSDRVDIGLRISTVTIRDDDGMCKK